MNNHHFTKSLLTVIGLMLGCSAFAAEPESVNHALRVWDDSARAGVPPLLKGWLIFMKVVILWSLCFVFTRGVSRWVVGGVLADQLLGSWIAQTLELEALVGYSSLMHLIFWTPALIVLLIKRPFMTERNIYGVWSGAVTFTFLVSFLFDIRDSVIYLDHITGLGILT
ncbi:hypothetical protein HBA55_18415 [Pseudomaricurvus alkylphenolicus]|uniref:hypothetical protein n=1 Tax=Pseudomaricurvus alkylphenolicus TaxID=1306991 RepID=UPI00141E8F6A|nr:hypothetical protein [Pseudomaricurvus alkylphenolicus]NIB41584.1 hypothetical protein [Pseudomaricurvus alkylphenolicus]